MAILHPFFLLNKNNDRCIVCLIDPEIVLLDEMGDPKHKKISMNLAKNLQSKWIVIISNNKDKNKVN